MSELFWLTDAQMARLEPFCCIGFTRVKLEESDFRRPLGGLRVAVSLDFNQRAYCLTRWWFVSLHVQPSAIGVHSIVVTDAKCSLRQLGFGRLAVHSG